MELKKLNFEMCEVEISESYVDEDGKIRSRVRKVMLPTGNILPQQESSPKKENPKK